MFVLPYLRFFLRFPTFPGILVRDEAARERLHSQVGSIGIIL